MADAFDKMLAAMLAPPDRPADRKFTATLRACIVLEQRLAAQRRTMLGSLVRQAIAVLAMAGAVWWFGRAGFIAVRIAQAPAVSLALLLVAFGFLLALITRHTGSEDRFHMTL